MLQDNAALAAESLRKAETEIGAMVKEADDREMTFVKFCWEMAGHMATYLEAVAADV